MNLVQLYYKEPLQEVSDGYGYLGALSQTESGDKVQCHICGELFYNLGAHAFNTHGIKAREYREQFQLNKRTPLCSDKASQDYKQRALSLWNNLSDDEKKQRVEKMQAVAKLATRIGREATLEYKNKKGICPDQLLEKIKTCAKALGKTPTVIELQEYYQTQRYNVPIQRTFGSYAKACEYAGLVPNKPGYKGGAMPVYSNEMLLQYLKDFYTRFNVVPTATDCHRGMIPSLAVYKKRFGGISSARKLANL